MNREEEMASAFQAIGRYVYEFSWLCWDLKMAIATVPGLTGSAYTTLELVTGEMTAAPLANACFAVCETAVEGDDEAVKIVRTLRARVMKEITRRNDLLHGDWMIGWVSGTGYEHADGTVEQVVRELPPTLTRVKPGRSGAKIQNEEILTSELEAEAQRLRTSCACSKAERVSSRPWSQLPSARYTRCAKANSRVPGDGPQRFRHGETTRPRPIWPFRPASLRRIGRGTALGG